MSDCCKTTSQCEIKYKANTRKCQCPKCGCLALLVSVRTMLHHIKESWNYIFSDEQYYFCKTEDCDVVYFTANGDKLNKTAIRTRIGIKEPDDSLLICYCFGINKAMAASSQQIKQFVQKQSKQSNCACETANPSGRCCLIDFPKFK